MVSGFWLLDEGCYTSNMVRYTTYHIRYTLFRGRSRGRTESVVLTDGVGRVHGRSRSSWRTESVAGETDFRPFRELSWRKHWTCISSDPFHPVDHV